MDLGDIITNSEAQDRGLWFDLPNPITGAATGIRLLIAGPDSRAQKRAQINMVDAMTEASDMDGRVSATDREKLRQSALAQAVLDWECSEGGNPVPFTHDAVLRLIRAARWVEAFIDTRAADRAPYFKPLNHGVER
jgi:hypothetical protein